MKDEKRRFRTSLLIKDEVFGSHRKPFEDECPFGLLFTILYDRDARRALTEKTTLTVEHAPSGEKRRIRVNFFAVDEYDMSTLEVLDEAAYDRWLDQVEPPETQD